MIKSNLIKHAEEIIKDFKELQEAGFICLDGAGINRYIFTFDLPYTNKLFD